MTQPLRFYVAELASEIDIMQKLAERFLAADASGILSEVKAHLETLVYATQETTIEVDTERPIRTIACDGGYERCGGGGRKDLFGELLFKWQFRPLGDASKKRGARRLVEVSGIASSVARLRIDEDGDETAIASWRMEFGDGNSPGAFFHAQIPDTLADSTRERPSNQKMWPSWLPVPRLPIPPMTPMLALEFVLAEIFQERWPQHLASGGYEVNGWRALQQRRYVTYFDWQRKNVETSGQGSPILATKNAKPAPEFFLYP